MKSMSRWEFTVPTPLGPTTSSYEIRDDALVFESDDPFADGGDTVRWESVQTAGTAAMAGWGGRGGPDAPSWMPTHLEWLMLSRADGNARPFMRPLPRGRERDAIVAAVRDRLGSRWMDEGIPLKQAQQAMGVHGGEWSKLKVAGIVVGVLALLVVLLIVLILLLSPLVLIPASVVLGAVLLRKGIAGHRNSAIAATLPTSSVGSAAPGLVQLQGRAVTNRPATPAPITGQPSIFWDVAVHLLYDDGDRDRTWRQVAGRYGGAIDEVELEGDGGSVPVWLNGAELLLERRVWESAKDTLPSPGLAFLDELGFPWNGGSQQIRVEEQSLAANGLLHVVGTLGTRRDVPRQQPPNAVDRTKHLLSTGEWRRALVAAVPQPLKVIVAVTIGYLDMMTRLGFAKERPPWSSASSPPPALADDAPLLWKGSSGRPFFVSDQPAHSARAALNRRSLITGGFGAAALCFAVYQLVEVFAGK